MFGAEGMNSIYQDENWWWWMLKPWKWSWTLTIQMCNETAWVVTLCYNNKTGLVVLVKRVKERVWHLNANVQVQKLALSQLTVFLSTRLYLWALVSSSLKRGSHQPHQVAEGSKRKLLGLFTLASNNWKKRANDEKVVIIRNHE